MSIIRRLFVPVLLVSSLAVACLATEGLGAEVSSQSSAKTDTKGSGKAYSEEIFADVTPGNQVRLRWQVDRWQEKQTGFYLYRRTVDAQDKTGPWESVTDEVIGPDLSVERLKKLKLDNVLAKMAQRKEGDISVAGILKRFSEDDGRGVLNAVFAGILDYQHAQAFGFGFIASGVKDGETYDFGVERAFEERKSDPKDIFATTRLTVRVGGFDCPPLVEFTAVRGGQDKLVKLKWVFKKSDLDHRQDIQSFAILKGEPDSPLETKMDGRHRDSFTTTPDGMAARFEISDLKAGDDPIKYAIAPVNRFGRMGQLSKRVVVRSKGPEIDLPVAKTEVQPEGVVISWKYPHPATWPIAGFRILRGNLEDIHKKDKEGKNLTPELLPPYQRQFIDRDALKNCMGQVLVYTLVVVSGDERADRDTYCGDHARIPYPKPPTPEDFSASAEVKDGKVYVHCRWKKVQSPGLSGYYIQRLSEADCAWVARHGAGPGDEERTFEADALPYSSTMTLRCGASADGGAMGDPGKAVTVQIPPVGELPPPANAFFVKYEAGVATFYWTDFASKDTKGYRILMDGKAIADEGVLGGYVRRWTTWTLPEGRHIFGLVKVDNFGRVSKPKDTEPTLIGQEQKVEEAPKALPSLENTKAVVEKTYFDEAKTKLKTITEYRVAADGTKFKHGTETVYSKNYPPEQPVYRQSYVQGQAHGPFVQWKKDGSIFVVTFRIRGQNSFYSQYVKEFGEPQLNEAEKTWLKAHPELD